MRPKLHRRSTCASTNKHRITKISVLSTKEKHMKLTSVMVMAERKLSVHMVRPAPLPCLLSCWGSNLFPYACFKRPKPVFMWYSGSYSTLNIVLAMCPGTPKLISTKIVTEWTFLPKQPFASFIPKDSIDKLVVFAVTILVRGNLLCLFRVS